nr:MAG TPA: hypothetical protein [Caudoviricetes sp.]
MKISFSYVWFLRQIYEKRPKHPSEKAVIFRF